MASSKSNFFTVDWSDFRRSVIPYVERSVSGSWFRRYLWSAALLWVLAALVSVFVTHSTSPLARDWRESYRLESESKDTTAWHQCGFCVVVDSPKRAFELETKLSRLSDRTLLECAHEDAERTVCSEVPWAVRSLLRDHKNAQYHADRIAESSTVRDSVDSAQVLEAFVADAKAAKYRPRIEAYRSPLGWSDFSDVLGLTCSLLLLFGVVVALPFRIVVLLGRELYHQTWTLLVATQQPVSRILFALVIQSLVPLAVVGAPLLLTVLGLMVSGGALLSALSFTLSMLALVAVWSAFGVTLPALMGRHIAPSFLTLFGLGVSGIYVLIVINVSQFVADSPGSLVPWLWIHSGLDVWAGAQAGFGVLGQEAQRFWTPSVARTIAQLALIPASLLWISAHAHRCQPGRKAGLSRGGWLLAWSLAGLVLGARCYAALCAVAEHSLDFGDWSWRRLGAYAIICLVIPFASYLTTAAHPLSHRNDARIDFATWGKRSFDAALAFGIVWFCQAGAIALAGACRVSHLLSIDGLVAAKSVVLWCVLMTGVSLLAAKGLDSKRAKFEFFSATLLGLSLAPAVVFACTASEYSLRHDDTFSVPSFIGFEFALYFVALGIVAWGIFRARPKNKVGA